MLIYRNAEELQGQTKVANPCSSESNYSGKTLSLFSCSVLTSAFNVSPISIACSF